MGGTILVRVVIPHSVSMMGQALGGCLIWYDAVGGRRFQHRRSVADVEIGNHLSVCFRSFGKMGPTAFILTYLDMAGSNRLPGPKIMFLGGREIWFASARMDAFFDPSRRLLNQL